MSKINKILKFASFLIIVLFIFNACNSSLFGIKGAGETVTEEVSIDSFNKIETAIDADIIITKGDAQKVEIEGQQNIIDNIMRNVKSGKWIIDFDKNVKTYEDLTIYITVPEISEIILSGSGDIYSDDTFDTNNLSLKISGSGDIDFKANTENTDISISGSGNIYTEGGTINQTISISGSGSYIAFSFYSKKTEITNTGSGNCKVYADKDLFVTISGSGNVYYKGNPSINSMISGSGKIINSN